MKIHHLLLGLIICVAGTGAIDLSLGFLDEPNLNQTPFLIFGHVWYEGGAPCNSPNVSITNLNTGAAWYADTVSDSNFYQTLLRAADVAAGDVLRWSATDGAVVNTTNCTVDLSNIGSGGIFGFNLTLVSTAPRIRGYAPESQIHDIENATRRFNITVDQVVDVTWLINGSPIHTNWSVTDASCTYTVGIGVWNISARASNANGTDMQEWIWNVTTLLPPNITSFDPPSPVRDTENVTRTFGIKVDQVVDVTWLINGTEVSDEADVNESSYTNTSAGIGIWNVTAVVSNRNGTDMQEWIWHVTSPAPAPSSVFGIYGNVSYDDGSACNSPFTVITNSNTSEELIAENRTGEGFYQLVTSSAFVNAGDVLMINAHKNGTPVGNATLTVNQTDIGNGAIKADINKRHLPDFTVTEISFNPSEPLMGDLVMINATIANFGAEGETSVEFYDNKSITIERTQSDNCESPINDTITLPDILRIRVHFGSSGGNITIYNESRMVERITRNGWTKWCDGDTVRIESWNAGFTVDRYEAVLANVSITLGEGDFINRSANWDLSLQEMGWATRGAHNITVRVDPYEQVIESDEANNEKTEVIDVAPSLDFAVTEISLNPSEPVLGDVVEVSVNMTNYGVRNGTTAVGVFYDNRSVEIGGKIPGRSNSTDNISLPADVHGLRIRFSYYELNQEAYINIYDEKGRLVERIYRMGERDGHVMWKGHDYWTDCIYSNAVTIEMYSGGGTTEFTIDRYEALIAEEPVTLNATESKVINASWRTGAAYGGVGDHNITVVVDLHNHSVETNETNNTLIEQVSVNGTDLAVTKVEIPCGYDMDNPCYMGQAVNITATIANLGAVDATNFTVMFRDGVCINCTDEGINTSGINFSKFHINRLNSGENRTVPAIWTPSETPSHTITVNISYDKYTDNNETNNELFNCSDVKARYDFFVERVYVAPQKDVRRGESVNITATIGNSNTSYGDGNVSIAFFVNSTDFAGSCGERFIRIETIDDIYLDVNETETVSVTWDTDVVGGCHLIAAVVNPDNELEELDGGTIYAGDTILFRNNKNNVKSCTLNVTPLDLDVTGITLDPADPNICDIVDVSATIRNNENMEAKSMVWFYMEENCSESRILQLENVMMRVHLLDVRIPDIGGGEVTASVNDSEGDSRPVHFYVKCKDYGSQDAEVRRIEGEETGCYIESGGYRHWDDVWTEWVNGTAIEINAEGGAKVSIDRYQVRLGNETVTLSAGESGVYHSTWNTSPPTKAGEDYRGMASVENRTIYSNVAYLGGTNLAITNLSVRSLVYDGDKVCVNATIENLGSVDATDFIVNFTEVYDPEETCYPFPRRRHGTHLEPINTTYIESLGAGSSINITLVWNASIRRIKCEGECVAPRKWESCTWPETADDYTIRIEINTLENEDKEEDDTNHTINSCVHVDESRDFKITDLSFRVNNESRDPLELAVYDDVILNATLDITNLANQGGMVNVSFYIDDDCAEHEIGNTTVAFPVGNGTGYAEIEWTVDSFDGVDIIGSHNMVVVADPENLIYEIDGDRNTTYTQPIYMKAPDPEVESLNIYPVNPERNETVSIDVTIANYGEVDAGNVTLTIYDWAERHIENASEQSGLGRDQIKITRSNATAMRLYLDLEVEGGSRVCVNYSGGRGIVCYRENFHGWTPWVLDNSTTIVVMNNGTDVAYAEVSKVYYIASSSIIDMSMHNLGVNETKKISVNWTPPTVGERFIAAIIDPVDRITEHNKSNNRLTEFVQVQAADLEVSDLSLVWLNGTDVGENDTVKHGDNVTVTTHLANIGVEDTGSFDVRLLAGDLLIKNERIDGLAPDESMNLSVNWSVTVGNHLLKIEADYRNEIDETNETNNIAALKRYVCGANLSGNTSWETLGLRGEILFGPDQPYDEDEVTITATINNSGCVPATDFDIAMFYDYAPDFFQKRCGHELSKGSWWINETYSDAEYLYLKVTTPASFPGYRVDCRRIIEDDVIVYDGDGNEVARPVAEPYKPCWVRVDGNTTNVCLTPEGSSLGTVFDIYFYPVYQNETSMLFEGIDLPVASSCNRSITRNVSAGDRAVLLIIDPENKVPEDGDYRGDNVVSRIMHVKPTRDFTVTNVTASLTNLSDLDTPEITANVSNIGLRNGTADVDFVDYEEEHRKYRYHFDANRSLSYLPIPPDARLSGLRYGEFMPIAYDNLMIIHRPGVDAIELHFDRIYLSITGMSSPCGVMAIYDENENMIWSKAGHDDGFRCEGGCEGANIPMVPGETAYIYTNDKADFDLGRYTTETEFHREEVRLNATKEMNESRNITQIRTAYTGDHTIAVTLDRDDKISEISESNNEQLSSPFHVNASRDPAVVMINITPELLGDGDDVDIAAIVANNGYRSANFTVDLWANLTRNETDPDESLPVADLTTDLGGDRIRYITLLNHTTVTLAPGENTTVNATWNDIGIAGSPEHHIIAIVDPTDEIDEMNESNNEINMKIPMNYSDLTVGKAHVHGGTGKAVVPIMEIGGVCGASDVTVRFGSYETEECTEGCYNLYGSISESGANAMQVHFKHLYARDGGVEVKDSTSSRVAAIKTYMGVEFSGVWGPWVKGDTVYIRCWGPGTYTDIDKYRWGNTSDEQIDYLPAGGSERVEIPWAYECPRRINVTVDPDNNITETNEDNNEESVLMYADLRAEKIEFVSPEFINLRRNKLSLDAEKFVIDGTIANGDEVGGDIVVPISDFNVTLEFRNRYPNGTDGDVIFNTTKHIEDPLCVGETLPIRFEFDPNEELKVGGNYTVFLIADSSGDVCESSDAYPNERDEDRLGERNNFTSLDIYVHNTSGYAGGGDLVNVAHGEVNGRVVYTIGDSKRIGGSGAIDERTRALTVTFDDTIPDGAEVEFARLYLYVDTGSEPGNRGIACPIEADMEFNGHKIQTDRRYTDISVASHWNVTYGLYCYDITDIDIEKENVAVATRISPYDGIYWFGIAAIGLLVVYEDEDEALTKYWINEGADVMMPDVETGLSFEDCIVTAEFDDVKREDLDGVNATLMTISSLVSGRTLQERANGEGDALEFNGYKIGTLINHEDRSHWDYQRPNNEETIAMTGNKWESVTDYLKRGNNLATMQSKGNYIMPANAFLRLIFPPDLNIINLTAPESTVVGAHHSINVTIRNDGRSDAHDFNVTFYIDKKQIDLDPHRLSDHIGHLDLPAGENMTLHLHDWTPMLLMHSYNLTAAADVLSGEDWTEIETDNNAMTKHVTIEEGGFGNQTGPRGIGGGSNPTGGEFTEEITGRVMQGIKDFLSGGGGGGAGMFSLTEWIMKGAVWLVLLLFVGLGYRMEQRSYGRVRVPGYAGGL